MTTQLYDRYYFQHSCGPVYERSAHWIQWFGNIADHIVQKINPRTVLDAGCAMGFLVEALRERGVEAYGIDISEYAIANVREDIRPFCEVGSILDPLPQNYNLIVSIEVLEHLRRPESEQALINLCRSSDDILFSSSPTDYREATHFNVQPPEVWAELFAAQGFFHDVDFDASFLTAWAVRFRRRDEPFPRLARDYERRFWQLGKENYDLRDLAVESRNRLAAQDEQIRQLDQQAAERVTEITTLHARLAEKEALVVQMQQHVEFADEQMRQMQQHVEFADSQLFEMQQHVEFADSQLREMQQHVEFADSQMCEMQLHVAFVDDQMSKMQQHVDLADTQIREMQQRVEIVENQMRAIQNSESWKAVQFLSRARRLFRKNEE